MDQNMKNSNQEMTLLDLLIIVWENKIIVALLTVLISFFGAFYAWKSPPVYKVNSVVQVEDRQGGAAQLMGQVSEVFKIKSVAETEIHIIQSRMVLGAVIDSLKLDIRFSPVYMRLIGAPMARRYNGSEPAEPPFFGNPKYCWGGEEIRVSSFSVPQRFLGESFIIQKQSGDKFSLSLEGEARVLVESNIGEPAYFEIGGEAALINIENLVAREGSTFRIVRVSKLSAINGVSKSLSVSEKGRQTGIIELTYQSGNPVSAAKILNEVSFAYVRQNVERKSAEAASTIEFLRRQLPVMRDSLDRAENRLNSFRLRAGTVDLPQEAKLALDQSVSLQSSSVDLMQRRESLLSRYREDHPEIVTINAQLAQIDGQLSRINTNVRRLPSIQQEFLSLTRDVEVANHLYTDILNKTQQLEVVKAGEIGNVRVIDTAEPNFIPVAPNRKMIFMAAFMAGLALGCFVVVAKSKLKSNISNPDIIEEKFGIPVYATVAHSKTQSEIYKSIESGKKGLHLLSEINPKDLAIESLKSLRTSLHFSMLDASSNIVMITGPSPSIGKSFISANFADVLANAGSKVLLIDGDLRKGKLHKYFGIARGKGLSDIISSSAKPVDCIKSTGVENLFFLSTGELPPNPSELLMHKNFAEFMESVQKDYDFVLIDSPPILAVTDAAIIGRYAATTLLLLKYAKHHVEEVRTAIKRLEQARVSTKGIIFNDIMFSSAGLKYGLYGKYGYYNYEYGTDTGKKE